MHGENENCIKISVGKQQVRKPLFIHRRGWENNIEKGLIRTESEHVDWIHLAWDTVQLQAFVRTVMSSHIP
jgi:hypothetical protein